LGGGGAPFFAAAQRSGG